jgi:hypothetical protein
MSSLSPFYSLECSCDEALHQVQACFRESGLRVMQTFDLHTTRHARQDCSCPNHTTETCDCQMVVLLVFGETTEPIPLILHGNHGRTWISFAENTSYQLEVNMRSRIEEILTVIPRK